MNLSVARLNSLLFRALVALALAASFCALSAARAQAAPSALNILIVHSYNAVDTHASIKAQLVAEPGVATVDEFEARTALDGGTNALPTAAQLAQHDAVVLLSDYRWTDVAALGNLLADYVDQGGVVFADVWNAWDPAVDAGYAPLGRWATGEYSPFQLNISGTEVTTTMGAFDNSNPVMSGLSGFQNLYTYTNAALTPGAMQLALLSNGVRAVAVKGQVVAVNAWLGDNALNSGNYGHLVVNGIKSVGRRDVMIKLAGTGKGAVTSSAGALTCAALCVGQFFAGRQMTLTAKAPKGNAFAGWSGACKGNTPTCALTVGYPGTDPALWNTPDLTARFATIRVKIGNYRNGKLEVTLKGAGQLTVTAPGTRTNDKNFKRGGLQKIAIKPKPSLREKIKKNGSVKVKFRVTYRPLGAKVSGVTTKTVKLTK